MWGFPLSVFVFIICVTVIGVAGVRLTVVADKLAEATGLGEALMGAVFVGAMTSLSGSITSITAAAQGHAQFAVSNAVGGIGVQMTFLAIADISYRKANLEHAAASEQNLIQTSLLLVLLILLLVAMTGPRPFFLTIHPITFFALGAYVFGLHLIRQAGKQPMWWPRRTRETFEEDKARGEFLEKGSPSFALWGRFFILAVIVAASGWALARAGISITLATGLSETFVGAIFTAASTSIPELVVALSAVKRGALNLAVGDIVGGNTFDTLIIGASDLVFFEDSIYHAVSIQEAYLLALSAFLSAVLLMGLLRREKHGLANIGLESVLIFIGYFSGIFFLFLGGEGI